VGVPQEVASREQRVRVCEIGRWSVEKRKGLGVVRVAVKDRDQVDGRSVPGRRISELRAMFTAELERAGIELAPMRRLLIDQAAHALALAELARGRYMRDGTGDLADLANVERRADQTIRRLGLAQDKPVAMSSAPLSLREKMIARYGEVET